MSFKMAASVKSQILPSMEGLRGGWQAAKPQAEISEGEKKT